MAQVSKVSGIVQIDGTPAQRTVRAFGYETRVHTIDGEEVNLSRSLGQATSDGATGEYTIDLLAGYGREIFVVAFDDYGADFRPDMALAVGDRVHPSTPNGYVWECAGAGTLPSEEPEWIIDTETAQLYGTASMITRPFYRPMVHGPVAPEVTITVAGDPHWDKVVALLHFDGDLTDETGRVWVAEGATPYVPGVFSDAVTLDTNLMSTSSSLDFVLDGDFTIECFINLRQLSGVRAILSSGVNGWNPGSVYLVFTSQRRLELGGYNLGKVFGGSHTFSENEWFYLTIVRKDGLCLVYEDGVLVESGAASQPLDFSTQGTLIGSHGRQPNTRLTGYIDELRITKGVARYTENFTPPTEPFPNFAEDGGEPEPEPLPTTIGEAFGGGFYAGDIEDNGQWYKLIVADIEADVYGLTWMDPMGDWPQAVSNTDGPSNTLSMAGDARFEAGNHCLDYRGGGFDDWYMPARDELAVLYDNLGFNQPACPPEFLAGAAQAFHASNFYWSSTQGSANSAWINRFSDGNETSNNNKYAADVRVRPVRRIPFTPEAG